MKGTILMVWHIFKKDWKLLWLPVLGAAGIQFISASLRYAMDHFAVGQALVNLFNLLQVATILVSVLLIATVIHQDAVPGVRQDWLVRPVSRRDLLLAKLLFVLVMVHGPILLADTVQALANGFSINQSLGAAGSRSIYLLLGLSIPVMAFASLTRNMAEAVIGTVGAFLGFAVLQILINNRGQAGELRGTGLFWIAESSMFIVGVIGSSIVLGIQYFRRKTILARVAMAVVAFLFMLAYLVPWNYGFALEERLASKPGAGSSILMTFNPSPDKFRLPSGVSHKTVTTASSGAIRDEASTVYLPLQVTVLPGDELLNTDKAEVVLMGADNKMLYRGSADELVIHKDAETEPVHFTIGIRRSPFFRDITLPGNSGSNDKRTLVYQGIALPRNLYDRIKDRPLRLEITYWLTLLHGSTYTVPALNGNVQIPNVGHCRTRMDDEGDDIQIRCIQAGAASTDCSTAFLEHAPSGRHNPTRFFCWPNYSPYFGQYVPDAMMRARAEFPFRDLAGLTTYPVDASQLPQSRIVFRIFQSQDHFTRQLVIPEVRLSDWESVEPATENP